MFFVVVGNGSVQHDNAVSEGEISPFPVFENRSASLWGFWSHSSVFTVVCGCAVFVNVLHLHSMARTRGVPGA
jgi:hypothetical protein